MSRGSTSTLSEVDQAAIVELAAERMGYRKIAETLGIPAHKVDWFLYANGLRRQSQETRAPYFRAGVLVVPFTEEEDATMEKMRIDGSSPAEIAVTIGKARGRKVHAHSVRTRLVMLASFREADLDETIVAPQRGPRPAGPRAMGSRLRDQDLRDQAYA